MSPVQSNSSSQSIATSSDVIETVSASQENDTETVAYRKRDLASTPPPDRTILPPEIGTHIGTYVLTEKLGEGVSCHVFRGEDRAQWKPVALKILNWANVFDRSAAMKQLRMEAAAAAARQSSVRRPLRFRVRSPWPIWLPSSSKVNRWGIDPRRRARRAGRCT